MGKEGGFLTIKREDFEKRDVVSRVKDFKEIIVPSSNEKLKNQAGRCMNCGVPFCHFSCPLGNVVPEFNEFVYLNKYKEAYEILESTHTLAEFTGRVCPALCEGGCVLGINEPSVAIKDIEYKIVEKAFEEGWVVPDRPKRTGKKVAVVGSGPAGLAAAIHANRDGHSVTVFERDENPGGILRYGIPDYKIEKWTVDRRIEVMKESGIEFICNKNISSVEDKKWLDDEFDAVILAIGSKLARDLPIEGRNLKDIHFAMDFLTEQNRKNDGSCKKDEVIAKDKNVIIIGGGDTGADCLGTSIRQGAKGVYQLELLPKPSKNREIDNPWPLFPRVLKHSTSHKEAIRILGKDAREYEVLTKRFIGDEDGNVKELELVKVSWEKDKDGRFQMKELPNSSFKIEVDLVLLAIGFTSPEKAGLIENFEVEVDTRGNIKANEKDFKLSKDKYFVAGDARKGQSLIVWAVQEGRDSAKEVSKYLAS